MKMTLDLPEELVRAVKLRAIEEDRTIKDTVADLLRCGLAHESADSSPIRNRVQLPLIKGGHRARPEEELTPERVAQILIDQEAEWHLDTLR
jgi:hypothetical protein